MTRLERRNRTGIEYASGGMSLLDLFDDTMKSTWRINDDEYDYICEFAEDVGCLILEGELSISQVKIKIQEVNELLEQYYEKNKFAERLVS